MIIGGEGAGQDLMETRGECDASGNIRFGDIGAFVVDQIKSYFNKEGIEVTVKYIDPSYTIRSMPANPKDSAFCLLLGHNAVHAGMTGRTDMVVGYTGGHFTHVPIPAVTGSRKQVDPGGEEWQYLLQMTGQPANMSGTSSFNAL